MSISSQIYVSNNQFIQKFITKSSVAFPRLPDSLRRLKRNEKKIFSTYQIETKSLISFENSSGSFGTGLDDIYSKMSQKDIFDGSVSLSMKGYLPRAHSAMVNPKLHISVSKLYCSPLHLSG